MEQSYIILFDGVCNCCNATVNFIIDRDRKNRFRFVALQSERGRELLRPFGLDTNQLDSIILIKAGRVFTRSGAVLEIARHLTGLWPLCYGGKIVPAFLRDALYNFVARRRYQLFGRSNTCRVPTPELKGRFLA